MSDTTAHDAVSQFDRDTAVQLREAGAYDATLSGGWAIGHALNGGYLLSTVGRALSHALPHPDPFSITAHYLTATAPGPALIRIATARSGRTVSTASAGLFQTDEEGREVERLRVLATYGDLGALTDDVSTTAKPPVMPPMESCFSSRVDANGPGTVPALMERLNLRLDPATCGWAIGAPSGCGEMRGWFAFADGHEPDPLTLLTAVDALPPTAFEMGLRGWVPTVELTAHVRARPAPGPLRVAMTSVNLAGGFLEEDAQVWDSADRLVAQSRQLARPKQG